MKPLSLDSVSRRLGCRADSGRWLVIPPPFPWLCLAHRAGGDMDQVYPLT